MDISIYEYRDYKRFLRELIAKTPAWKHGGRMRFAEAIECKPGYVTQVLGGSSHFSLEQGERLGRFIGLNGPELHYLLLLVNFARAGTSQLKEYFRAQIDQISAQRVNLKDKVKAEEILGAQDQAVYYSSWHYAVVHILCTIPSREFREKAALRLGISNEKFGEILGFLESTGLIERTKTELKVTSKRVFMEKDSVFNYRHHANFRQLAMMNLDKLDKKDFHYSGVHSLSAEDSAKIVEYIRELIVSSRKLIKDSPEEELFGFNIDFFRV